MKGASVIAVALTVLTAGFAASAAAQDVAGSSDHPVVARYKGATIRYQSRLEFDAFTVPLGPADKSQKKFKKEEPIEGKVVKTRYQAPAGASTLAVSRSYQDALTQAGFEILYACSPKQCNAEGSVGRTLRDWIPDLYQFDSRWPDDEGTYFFSARKNNVYVVVSAFNLWGIPSTVFYTVNVVEVKPLQTELVVVKAETLASDITKLGHASIYGIYFDTGKSVIKPESQQTIAEIAKLLTAQPSLRLHVVGHTDNVGTLPSNMMLSKQRAEAVVNSLVNDHRIAASRLIANGVGPLAPVASNAAEDGRAKNRRVELVGQ